MGNPVGKIAEIAVCRNVFLTIWHCILSAAHGLMISNHSNQLNHVFPDND